MYPKISKLILFLASILLSAIAYGQSAPNINFTNIDVAGATVTIATGINNSGIITGTLLDSTGAAHGYLANKTGKFIKAIDFPGAPQTQPSGINERGDIVGSYLDNAGSFHGFLLHDSTFTTIDFPGATANFPLDINDQGVIAGLYQDAALLNHGFTLDSAGFHTLDDPAQASPTTELMSINSQGKILGDFDINEFGLFGSAFLFTHGTFVPVTVPGASNGILALGLNNGGDVAGSFLGDDFVQHGFISGNDGLITFDFPCALATPQFRSTLHAVQSASMPIQRSIPVASLSPLAAKTTG